jgi:hypothetical protein
MGLAALDAVMLRARAAPLLLSLSLAEGTKERQEETCTRAYMCAACRWAGLKESRREGGGWNEREGVRDGIVSCIHPFFPYVLHPDGVSTPDGVWTLLSRAKNRIVC